MKRRILFLCTGNSCRSQMAEGWARALLGDRIEPYSAGIKLQDLNPLAVKVMAEVGVDISHHYSKTLAELGSITFDLIVTVCDSAATECPRPPPGARLVHLPFDDPPRLARELGDQEKILELYRRVRDEIREGVLELLSETAPW